jgi:hypothetical protein
MTSLAKTIQLTGPRMAVTDEVDPELAQVITSYRLRYSHRRKGALI